ncbi:MAG: PBP1A family penicillin-binding protein [bacterium]|nr:PBP1A family penicillin-binding protein [bacterium]
MALSVLLLVAVLATLGFVFLIPLPPLPQLEATRVFDINGELVASLFRENRVEVPLASLPRYLPAAVVAIEDRHFYRHPGVDPLGVLRALYRNLLAGRVVEGGSTITQQLAKILFLRPERTLTRKLLELPWTFKLEVNLSKDQILERYLNQIYLGHGSHGVEVAARTYFGKGAADLTLAEAALLAALARGPEVYSPYRNPERALRRRATVLAAMVDAGLISPEQAEEAGVQELELAGLPVARRGAPYFVDWIVEELLRGRPDLAPDLAVGGYRLYTTLDVRLQAAAEAAVRDGLPPAQPDGRGVDQPQAALVAIDPQNGHVLAMVGGRDYRQTQLNRAVAPEGDYRGMRRPPGSAFKPFLYAAVIDRGFTTVDRVRCQPVTFDVRGSPPYSPTDFGAEPYHHRDLSVREALAQSCNVVAVTWANRLGPAVVAEYAARLGVTSALRPVLSIPLGTSETSPLEMASAYATLAAGGLWRQPVGLLRVEDRRGRVLYRHQGRSRQALRPAVAYVVVDLMKSVLRPGGTAARLGALLGRPAAAKTGTSSDRQDAWFVGMTPELAVAVWVGCDRPSPLPTGGAGLAGPVWVSFVRQALAGSPVRDFSPAPGVRWMRVCRETGLTAGPTCPGEEEIFVNGTQPPLCPGAHFSPQDEDDAEEREEPAAQGGAGRSLADHQQPEEDAGGNLLGGNQVDQGGGGQAEGGIVEGVAQGGRDQGQEEQGRGRPGQPGPGDRGEQGQGGKEDGRGQVYAGSVSVQGIAIALPPAGQRVDSVTEPREQGQEIAQQQAAVEGGLEAGHDGNTEQGHDDPGIAGGMEALTQDRPGEQDHEDGRQVDQDQGVGDGGQAEGGDVEEEVEGGDEAVEGEPSGTEVQRLPP